MDDEVLRNIPAFMAVAEQKGVSRASEFLFKAPSALTRSIALLEETLGFTLFDRLPHGMLMNHFGEAVQERSRRILMELKIACEELGPICRPAKEEKHLSAFLLAGRKLQVFASIAEHQSLSEAGKQLTLSRSGVSMSLSRMEEYLGIHLFERMAHGLIPNTAGEKLLIRAKRISAEIRHLKTELSALAGALKGTVIIGALPLCRTRILPKAISQLLITHPDIQVKTLESPYDELAKGLKSGDIDFIIGAVRGKAEQSEFQIEHLFMDQVSIFCRANHPLTQRNQIDLATLSNQQWILPRQDSPARQVLTKAFLQKGLTPPQPAIESGDLAILRYLLASTDLITAISPFQLFYEIKDQLVEALPIDLDNTQRSIGITSRKQSLPSPAVLEMMNEVKRVIREEVHRSI